MAIDREIVASLGNYLANSPTLTVADLASLLDLAETEHPDAIAVTIDKGITIDELHAGLLLALSTRIGEAISAGHVIADDGGESLKPINHGR